jgi:FkbM family methyltransferase
LFVSPDAALQYWKWNLDFAAKALFDFTEEFVRTGDVVWDVGANVGMFSFASAFHAGQSGRVLAIEPDVFLVDLLRRSAALRSPERASVAVLPAAVSDSLGVAEFHIAKRGRSANYLASASHSTQTGGVRETVLALTITLDWLAAQFPEPRVLKIDVEGAEARVLAGAEQLVSRAKPIILCEVSKPNEDACTRFFRAHGYRLYDADNRNLGAIEKATYNTLAVCEG